MSKKSRDPDYVFASSSDSNLTNIDRERNTCEFSPLGGYVSSEYLQCNSQFSQKSYDNTDTESFNFSNNPSLDYLMSLNPASQDYEMEVIREKMRTKNNSKEEREKLKEGRNRIKEERNRLKEERNRLKEEKNRLKDEELKERLRKAEHRNCNARMKPGNCMKYITVIIDSDLVNEKYGGNILQSIVQSGSSHQIKRQLVRSTITWTRNTLEGNSEVEKEEEPVLLLWNVSYFLSCIKDGTLNKKIESIQETLFGKRLTLAIFEMDSWFFEQERLQRKKFKGKVLNSQPNESSNENVTRDLVEEHIAELQILYNLATFNVNKFEEVGELVSRFTKSIAETPYKIEMRKRQVDSLGWSASCDLKEKVRVDKSGNGFSRLWLQQLIQFNNVNLDIAQAIIQLYPTPSTLYKAYINCESQEKGEELLKDILIRRGLGEAAAIRRVGPEISKEIYNFFTSNDKDYTLVQE